MVAADTPAKVQRVRDARGDDESREQLQRLALPSLRVPHDVRRRGQRGRRAEAQAIAARAPVQGQRRRVYVAVRLRLDSGEIEDRVAMRNAPREATGAMRETEIGRAHV